MKNSVLSLKEVWPVKYLFWRVQIWLVDFMIEFRYGFPGNTAMHGPNCNVLFYDLVNKPIDVNIGSQNKPLIKFWHTSL